MVQTTVPSEVVPSVGVPGSMKKSLITGPPSVDPGQLATSKMGIAGKPTLEPCTMATADPLAVPHRAGMLTVWMVLPTAPSAARALRLTARMSASPETRQFAILETPLFIVSSTSSVRLPGRLGPWLRRSILRSLDLVLLKPVMSGPCSPPWTRLGRCSARGGWRGAAAPRCAPPRGSLVP